MTAWLTRILAEVAAVTDEQANSLPPDDEISCKCEHVVGVLSMDLKKIRFVAGQYLRREYELKREVRTCGETEREALEQELARYHLQAQRLSEIFWVSCLEAFPELWGKAMVAIRKDDQIIWSEHGEQAAAVNDLLEEMFGGDSLFGRRSGLFGGRARIFDLGDFLRQ